MSNETKWTYANKTVLKNNIPVFEMQGREAAEIIVSEMNAKCRLESENKDLARQRDEYLSERCELKVNILSLQQENTELREQCEVYKGHFEFNYDAKIHLQKENAELRERLKLFEFMIDNRLVVEDMIDDTQPIQTTTTPRTDIDGNVFVYFIENEKNEWLYSDMTFGNNPNVAYRFKSHNEAAEFIVYKNLMNCGVTEHEFVITPRTDADGLVKELLLYAEPDGFIVNGFRTKEIVYQLLNQFRTAQTDKR